MSPGRITPWLIGAVLAVLTAGALGWATGAGSASPVVSTTTASNRPGRFIRFCTTRIRSPRTVQQMQPLFIS